MPAYGGKSVFSPVRGDIFVEPITKNIPKLR